MRPRARLRELPVDLLFLDIKMPGATGFDLLERLDHVPLLVFTTAYDEFALRAFEVNACDYLLKPIRPDRLAAALDKMRTLLAAMRAAAPRRAGTTTRRRPIACSCATAIGAGSSRLARSPCSRAKATTRVSTSARTAR